MNVASHLWNMAACAPNAVALEVQRTGERLTFAELAARAAAMARGLQALGIGRGDRVLLMVRPGVDFAALAFALLALGAVAVFVDPGIGRKHLVESIAQARPKCVIGERLLYLLSALHPRMFAGVQVRLSIGWWPGAVSVARLRKYASDAFKPLPLPSNSDAVVAFTSGATGCPKGVLLQHAVLSAQLELFRRLSGIREGHVYLAILPVLAILGPGFGCCTVLPAIDPARPRAANAANIVSVILRYGITHSFGSPAIWRKVAEVGKELPSMRCLMVGGAPAAPALLARLAALMPNGDVHTPYGATEAMPLACASSSEILMEGGTGRGTLVGHPLSGIEIRIVEINDGPLTHARPLAMGEIGEIAVRGTVVSRSYHAESAAATLAKIPDATGAWHRMGDLGSLDSAGRLWFCGRKSERVCTMGRTLYTACVEPRFESHPVVQRAALVGAAGKAVLVVEPKSGARVDAAAAVEILALRGDLPIDRVLFKSRLPLDVRHAAKILRGELAHWVVGQLT